MEFGLDTNYGMVAPVDDVDADEHRTLLLGMKPDRDYHFHIVVTNSTGTYASQDRVIHTGPPTDLVEISRFDVLDDSARERGFILTSYFREEGSLVPFILDADGDIVWWYQRNPSSYDA